MKTNIRTFSSKKLVLGLVTTAIGISTIALVSENAHASTATVKSQTVTKTTKPAPVTTKPSTTVKTVKPVMVKTSTTIATTNVTTKKPQSIVKPIAQKAPVTKKSVSVKKPVSKAVSTTTIKAPVASKPATPTMKKPITVTKAPKPKTMRKPSTVTKVSTPTTVKKSNTTTKAPSKTQTTSVKTPSKSTMTQTPPKTSSTLTSPSEKLNTSSKVPTTTAPVQSSTITKTPVRTNEELQNIATPKLENTNTQGMTLQSQEAVKPTTEAGTNTQNTTRKQDYYKSMTELYNDTKEGIDWKKDTRDVGKSVLIVAPHGGNIEQGTSELTKLVANNGDFDYFSFEAIRPSNNTQLHVTSTNYDDATLHDMIQDRTATISIHGAQGEEQLVYLGGYQSPLRDAIQSQLERKGFVVKIPPEYLSGLSNANFINKVEESTGVQLELTTALRKAFFKDGDASTASRKKIENWTTTMYDFAEALNGAIKQVYPENQG
ncbi:poly-gamma-glutamate hydrolase family protein [Staphylococcus sp. GDY8P94P]|uniref:poly-gamma-glutamate hydrolase family protein n=1 Tax=Staphylococcus sp. GDY8P94P TaxID=2804144 RepID=UPI001FD88626|nr:poly-gamma-glutamate hydrolase family protein [Staphylococcus sp. GDY8P94P]